MHAMAPDPREEDRRRVARNKLRALIRAYIPRDKRLDHCQNALRKFLDEKVRNAHAGKLWNDDLVDLIEQFSDDDLNPSKASKGQMEEYFRDLLMLFPRALDMIEDGRRRDTSHIPCRYGPDCKRPDCGYKHESRPVNHDHGPRPSEDSPMMKKNNTRIIPGGDPRLKWKHSHDRATANEPRALSDPKKAAETATHKIRNGLAAIMESEKNARERAKMQSDKVQADQNENGILYSSRDKRPIDPKPKRERSEKQKAALAAARVKAIEADAAYVIKADAERKATEAKAKADAERKATEAKAKADAAKAKAPEEAIPLPVKPVPDSELVRFRSDPKFGSPKTDARERQIERMCNRFGLRIVEVAADGNCLFRALSMGLYGTDAEHATVRKIVTGWMSKLRFYFEPFYVPSDNMGKSYDQYVKNMRRLGEWGDGFCLRAFARVYKERVFVIKDDKEAYVFSPSLDDSFFDNLPVDIQNPIIVSFHGNHYNLVEETDTNQNKSAECTPKATADTEREATGAPSEQVNKKRKRQYMSAPPDAREAAGLERYAEVDIHDCKECIGLLEACGAEVSKFCPCETHLNELYEKTDAYGTRCLNPGHEERHKKLVTISGGGIAFNRFGKLFDHGLTKGLNGRKTIRFCRDRDGFCKQCSMGMRDHKKKQLTRQLQQKHVAAQKEKLEKITNNLSPEQLEELIENLKAKTTKTTISRGFSTADLSDGEDVVKFTGFEIGHLVWARTGKSNWAPAQISAISAPSTTGQPTYDVDFFVKERGVYNRAHNLPLSKLEAADEDSFEKYSNRLKNNENWTDGVDTFRKLWNFSQGKHLTDRAAAKCTRVIFETQRRIHRRRACVHCGTIKTPQWRAGPEGPKTLCNACGAKHLKQERITKHLKQVKTTKQF